MVSFWAELNAQAHRELPNHSLSDSPEPQPGSDAVARLVRRWRLIEWVTLRFIYF
jgi:hypothetical protein